MPQIRPITDLRNTNEISEICHAKNEPLFITKNGYGHLVVMSMETYEKQMRLLDIYSKLATAEEQVRDGRTMTTEDSMQDLRGKHGL